MRLLLLAIGSMFLQTTFVSLGKVLPAVLAPVVLIDLDIAPSWFGIYMVLVAGSALVIQLGCGSFTVRYGALRVRQVALIMTGLGLAFVPIGLIWILVAATKRVESGDLDTGIVGSDYRRSNIFHSREFASPWPVLSSEMGASCFLD